MAFKPSIFDIKYQNMNQEDTLLNYERDMMLYEQTEALEKMQKAQEEALRNAQISNLGSSAYSSYTRDYDNLSDDDKLIEIDFDIWDIEADKRILGKKIDSRIETLCSKIKYKTNILNTWIKVREITGALILFSFSISWMIIIIVFGNTNSSELLKNGIIALAVTLILLYLFAIKKISSTKNDIFRLYDKKIKITQEIKAKSKKKKKKKSN